MSLRGLLRLAMLLSCASCGGDGAAKPAADNTAPAKPPKIDVARAMSDPAALRDAVARPARELLPSYRLKATTSVKVVEAGVVVEALDEEALVERASGGELHSFYGNSREHGIELYAAGGTIWVRPRYGKFHRRPPAEKGEAERAADEASGSLAAYLELVLPGAAVSDGGEATVAGRAGRKVVLTRGAGKAARPAATAPGKAWRAGATVDALDGELVLDAATGAVLLGRLAAKVSFERDDKKFEMTLSATHALEDVGGAIAITPPAEADSMTTPGRSTEVDDREELLGGLAPPARRRP